MKQNIDNDEWRYNAISVTKYNPNDINKNLDWTSYSEIGLVFNGKQLSIEEYIDIEMKYIKAAYMFFEFHNCSLIKIENVSKFPLDNNFHDNNYLINTYNLINNNNAVPLESLKDIIKLILRGFIWAELFCINTNSIAVRFGYDLYMYFNSPNKLDSLIKRIESLGLFVEM